MLTVRRQAADRGEFLAKKRMTADVGESEALEARRRVNDSIFWRPGDVPMIAFSGGPVKPQSTTARGAGAKDEGNE
jgi:hypothetical protein